MYQTGMSRVRVLHASPDAPAVDIFVDGSSAITGLSFGSVSDYAELPAGSHNVKVFPAGMGGGGQAVIDADITIDANQDYTVGAVGRLSSIRAIIMPDSAMAPGGNRANVRVLHASPDAPSVDVGVMGGPTLFSGVSFTEATPFMAVDAGTVDLEVRPSGSTQPVLSIPGVDLQAGNNYTFVALGLLQGTPSLMVMPIVDRAKVGMPL